MLRIIVLLSLISCTKAIPKKIFVPKPIINDIVFEFKPMQNKNDINSLYYNIQLARVYFNQQTNNLKLTQDYYSKVIADLGGIEQ